VKREGKKKARLHSPINKIERKDNSRQRTSSIQGCQKGREKGADLFAVSLKKNFEISKCPAKKRKKDKGFSRRPLPELGYVKKKKEKNAARNSPGANKRTPEKGERNAATRFTHAEKEEKKKEGKERIALW